MKNKIEMMREIRELNPSVSEEFLQEFSVDDLREYLDRLNRVGRSAWMAWEPETTDSGVLTNAAK